MRHNRSFDADTQRYCATSHDSIGMKNKAMERAQVKSLFVRLVTILLWSALIPYAAAQQSSAKAPVYIQATAEDTVGKLLVYEVREVIRRSSGLALVDRDSDARFVLRVVTIDPDRSESPGLSTIYSAVYTVHTFHETPVEMYLTNVVGVCGSSRVESCARKMIATLDEQAVGLRTMLRNALDSGDRPK